MSEPRHLRGSCNCGRNRYSITVPPNSPDRPTILFDSRAESRRSLATPLTPLLRIPLPWFSSHTIAYLPDETHSSIRRKFQPPHEPATQRVFCGYCGTPLSVWTERPHSEAAWIQVTVGSLLGEDAEELDALGALPTEDDGAEQDPVARTEEDAGAGAATAAPVVTRREGRTAAGLQWFEELLEGSRLGRTQSTRRGVGVSEDGTTRVEWEVSELYDDGNGQGDASGARTQPSSGKRKIDDLGGEDDTEMRD